MSPEGTRGLTVGLTGGIASGKSLVSGVLRELGAVLIDADAVAREVVAPGSPVLQEIIAAFGPTIVAPDGALDRGALAGRIFTDPESRRRLNAIMHPPIRHRMAEAVQTARARRPEAVIVLDIPLLLDTAPAAAYSLDGIVVVYVDEATQVARLAVRDGLSPDAARRRIAAQRPLRDKVPEATWVIDNSGTPDDTRRQVEALWRRWQARH
jgi:dephospho-CoA kinase